MFCPLQRPPVHSTGDHYLHIPTNIVINVIIIVYILTHIVINMVLSGRSHASIGFPHWAPSCKSGLPTLRCLSLEDFIPRQMWHKSCPYHYGIKRIGPCSGKNGTGQFNDCLLHLHGLALFDIYVKSSKHLVHRDRKSRMFYEYDSCYHTVEIIY